MDYVVGLEWGSLVGAFYAQSGLIHEVEWKLYKLEEKDVVGRSLFSSSIVPESVERSFVGRESCITCHQEQADLFHGER